MSGFSPFQRQSPNPRSHLVGGCMSRKTTFAVAALLSIVAASAAFAQGTTKADSTMKKGTKMEKTGATVEKAGKRMEAKAPPPAKKGTNLKTKAAREMKKDSAAAKKP